MYNTQTKTKQTYKKTRHNKHKKISKISKQIKLVIMPILPQIFLDNSAKNLKSSGYAYKINLKP